MAWPGSVESSAARLNALSSLGATLALMLTLSLTMPALAAGTGATTIAADTATPRTSTTSERPAPGDTSFAVLSNMPSSMTNERDTQGILQSIAQKGQVHFIVDLGNVRGADESCGNALFARRRAMLDATPAPVVFVPGVRDWVDCARPGAGSFDPIERLDTVRDLFLSGNVSLGAPPMHVIRQSELPAFTPYRENMRWIEDGVVFVTLNVPGGNNHFVDGGGRNGEYEDREVANRNWIDHAVTDALRRHARGLVFLFEGDPGFASSAAQAASSRPGRSHWAASFDWWFRRPRERDGYASLRRDLLQALARFNGPVLIIHGRDARHGKKRDAAAPPAVAVETLTRAPDGVPLHDVRQVMVDNPPRSQQWLRITLPNARDVRPVAPLAASTRNHSSGTARSHGANKTRAVVPRATGFGIRLERIDGIEGINDSAMGSASGSGGGRPTAMPVVASSPAVQASGSGTAAASSANGNDQGLPPWPGNAYRFQRQDDETAMATHAAGATGRTAPFEGSDDGGNRFSAPNAKSTSEHDVLHPAAAASGALPAWKPANALAMPPNAASLPGDLPEPADPVENGVDDNSGTSALNGITRPIMLPLPRSP
ncbi:hypothetical protein [Robbsia sp. KACC 23696]|uniref:hypothetical protein n=1 Tax=Robbsia sp. KACC 23696 TaxID=3149231 RepID=UPI00325BC27C